MSRLKYSTQEMASLFAQQGCELLGEYRGCQQKMKYRCSCGCYSFIDWNHFSAGKRCGHCVKYGRKKKRTLEQVQCIFIERGCEFLDDSFQGVHHKHRYRCQCGREDYISFAAFHHQKQNCQQCGFEKLRGENNPEWRSDRKQLREDQLFRKKCYKALASTLKACGCEKIGRTTDMLGYGPKQLQEHIVHHPNWHALKDNPWHLDHIFPIMAFLDNNIRDIGLINNLDNLQPITQRANVSKSDHYDQKEFEKWLASKGACPSLSI